MEITNSSQLNSRIQRQIDHLISSDDAQFKSRDLGVDQVEILILFKFLDYMEGDELISLLGRFNRANELFLQYKSNQKSIITYQTSLISGKRSPTDSISEMNVIKMKANKLLERATLIDKENKKIHDENIMLKQGIRATVEFSEKKNMEKLKKENFENELELIFREHRIEISHAKKENDGIVNDINILEAKIDNLDNRIELMTSARTARSSPYFKALIKRRESFSDDEASISSTPNLLMEASENIQSRKKYKLPMIHSIKFNQPKIKEPNSMIHIPTVFHSPRNYQKPVIPFKIPENNNVKEAKYSETSFVLINEITDMIQSFRDILEKSKYEV